MKADVKRFGFNNVLQDFKFMKNVVKIVIYVRLSIGLVVRVFATDQRDRGSIPRRVIPNIQKMVLDACLLNTWHYEV